LEVHI